MLYSSPGRARMLIPMKDMRTVAMVTNISPAIAEVMISLAALTLSGLPPDVASKKKPNSIRSNAKPPPMPTAKRRISPANSWGSVETQPIAVLTPPVSLQLRVPTDCAIAIVGEKRLAR